MVAIHSYIILTLELIGTVAFATSGALLAIDKGLDLFGVVVLSVTTASGGGIIRDIILGITPPTLFVKPIYFIVAIAVAIVMLVVAGRMSIFENQQIYSRYLKVINISDAIGLGVFTVMAMITAFNAGYSSNIFLCIFVSVITGVGGGMLRDVLVQRTPLVLREEIYATASIIGGIIFYLSDKIFGEALATIIGIVVVVLIRILSLFYGLQLPRISMKQ